MEVVTAATDVNPIGVVRAYRRHRRFGVRFRTDPAREAVDDWAGRPAEHVPPSPRVAVSPERALVCASPGRGTTELIGYRLDLRRATLHDRGPRRWVLGDPWLQVRCAWKARAKQPGEILDGQGLCEEKSLRD
jgi:hypothetical protein